MRPSEDSLIATYFAPIAGEGALGLRDDAALVKPTPGHEIVVTADALVGGVHFFADDPAAAIARKALRVNLSDLAAKGADPVGFLLALALPDDWTTDWLAAFAAGMGEDSAAYSIGLLGGDTVSTPGPLTISVTAIGSVPAGRMVPRTGVQPGDQLFVSGTIGDSALGLQLRRIATGVAPPLWSVELEKGFRDHLLDRYALPQPRTALRAALRAQANGAMDVSDGLVGDLTKMLRVSGVTGTVHLPLVPLSDAARRAVNADSRLNPNSRLFETALTGGDDYEIIASVPPTRVGAFEAQAREAGVAVAMIGEASEGTAPPRWLDGEGRPRDFSRGSYSHF